MKRQKEDEETEKEDERGEIGRVRKCSERKEQDEMLRRDPWKKEINLPSFLSFFFSKEWFLTFFSILLNPIIYLIRDAF